MHGDPGAMRRTMLVLALRGKRWAQALRLGGSMWVLSRLFATFGVLERRSLVGWTPTAVAA